jgi:hypothetical protein
MEDSDGRARNSRSATAPRLTSTTDGVEEDPPSWRRELSCTHVAWLMWMPDVLRRPNEGNLDEAWEQATAAPVAPKKKALDVQRTRIISLLRLWGGLVRHPDYLASRDHSSAELSKAIDPELRSYFHGGLVHHPLIIASVTANRIQYINETYRKNKADARKAEREGDWQRLIRGLYERPYRIKALRKALRRIADPKEAARLVGDVWRDSENIRQHRSAWHSIWTGLADPWAAMDEKEQAELATFPDKLTIFRGHGGRRGLTKGLSWTMDQAEAEWFARRSFRGPPFVASGWVFKIDVFAYFNGRKESEIVVSPDSVRDVTVTTLLPLPRGAADDGRRPQADAGELHQDAGASS